MALPFEIQIGRISRFLSKWASTKGSSPRVSLGSEIIPVIPMWSGVEARFLDSWDLFGMFAFVAAVAAQNSRFRIRNPKSSNVVGVISALSCLESASADNYVLQKSVTNTADLTPVIPTGLDSRGRPSSTLIVSSGTAAADMTGALSVYSKSAPASTTQEFIVDDNQEIPVLPGTTYELKASTVNVAATFNVLFRERALEESELS